MLTLHGFPFSNYHNIVKHTLLHKNVPFNEHIVYPGSPELTAVNPAGKVPAMTTEKGTLLSESSVLVDYLEDAYPEIPLYPTDADDRAQVRRLMKISELYLELPARRLLPAELGKASIDENTQNEVRAALKRGITALKSLAQFSPYLTGSDLTLADIYLRYALSIPKLAVPQVLEWNIMEEVPGLISWDAMMADTDIARKIDADREANTAEFMAYISSRS